MNCQLLSSLARLGASPGELLPTNQGGAFSEQMDRSWPRASESEAREPVGEVK